MKSFQALTHFFDFVSEFNILLFQLDILSENAEILLELKGVHLPLDQIFIFLHDFL